MTLRLRSLVWLASLSLGLAVPAIAQETTQPEEGLRENRTNTHVLVDAKIVTTTRTIEKGSLVVRDGKIIEIGEQVAAPPGARIWNVAGKTIYPGFIDSYSETPETAAPPRDAAGSWNSTVTPERRVGQTLQLPQDKRRELRKAGVVATVVAPSTGIIRGQSALVSTAAGDATAIVLNESAALHVQLTPGRGSGRRESFPGSPMGAVALLRQQLIDANWYTSASSLPPTSKAPRPAKNESLEALAPFAAGQALVMIDSPDELYALRADAIADEFALKAVVRGSGREYRRLDDLVAAQRTIILPLNFPQPPDVSSPTQARDVSLERLLHWDLAPENPARLAKAKVKFALTTFGLKNPGEFLPALRVAVARGLPASEALRALTAVPAELFAAPTLDGSLEPGETASFLVVDGDLFADDESKIVETWVEGSRYPTEPTPAGDLSGVYSLEIDGAPLTPPAKLVVSGKPKSPKGKTTREGGAEKDAGKLDKLEVDGSRIRFSTGAKSLSLEPSGAVILDGIRVGDRIDGNGVRPDGSTFRWSAVFTGPAPTEDEAKEESKKPGDESKTADAEKKSDDSDAKGEEEKESKPDADSGKKKDAEKKKRDKKSRPALFAPNYPLGAFGVAAVASTPDVVLFKNATLWVCDGAQPLEGADLLIVKGKIQQVGKNIAPPAGAVIVNATGKHITPGLIDCHSHSATDGGINESTQSVTAEVRIGDFIDCDDVNIYRQLAGGITTINVLHGSANCIGGQNQVLKLRWGLGFDAMRFSEAPPGIKFALGENVKQSNWGDDHRSRYPQSRLGVDQVTRDAFQAAREYAARMKNWDPANPPKDELPPRRDLELEALAQVVSGERLIHCHSYRQDEIVTFLRVCEDFNVRVATLQHILEGYKVSEVIKQHGAGVSSFSDWWAYKYEVIDSIPYNGAIMNAQGLVVSFNSDSSELARRMSWETAKSVKYGNVPEARALQFVTLNPAKQLKIDQYIGSLEAGKHADVAVWNGSPLSSLAVCEQTWIEGRKFFDRAEDIERQAEARKKKAALIQRALDSGEEPAEEEPIEEKTFWPRHDEFCHHGEGHDHH